MATTAINTLRFARRPKDAGVPDAQAETMAEPVITLVGAARSPKHLTAEERTRFLAATRARWRPARSSRRGGALRPRWATASPCSASASPAPPTQVWGSPTATRGARDWRLGWRLTSAAPGDPGFEVSLDATRREPANDNGAGHGVMLRSLIRW